MHVCLSYNILLAYMQYVHFLFFGTVNANGILRAQTYITHKKHGILVCTDVSYYIIYIYNIYIYSVCVHGGSAFM